jgi:hypothetical protein
MGSPDRPGLAVYTLRVDRSHLDRLTEIAAAEHRTLVQKLRVMIEAEITRHDDSDANDGKAAA